MLTVLRAVILVCLIGPSFYAAGKKAGFQSFIAGGSIY